MLLAATKFATVVPFAAAILFNVSPDLTVYEPLDDEVVVVELSDDELCVVVDDEDAVCSCCPTKIKLAFEMLLALTKASTVVPFADAIL